MSTLPSLKPREVERILLNAGFIPDTSKGSHRTYYHPGKRLHATVAFHPGDVPTGTLRSIMKQSGMQSDEFLAYKKKKK